jgi:CheY-like chemotaxis protein
MNILLVEDEDPKLAGIQKFLKDFGGHLSLEVARSVKAGLESLQLRLPDVLILDMSLPTFDITAIEPGGRPQGFGGIEIIRYLDSLDAQVPTIVVSAYEAFAKDGKNIDLRALEIELVRDFPQLVKGVVYFNPLQADWSGSLRSLLAEARGVHAE